MPVEVVRQDDVFPSKRLCVTKQFWIMDLTLVGQVRGSFVHVKRVPEH